MATEKWYFVDTAGEACGAGDREDLELDGATAATTKLLDGTGDTWNVVETRTIPAGDWQVSFRADVGAGFGTPQVSVEVRRMNSSCVLQEAIIFQTVTLVSNTEDTYTTVLQGKGDVTFEAGDILKIEILDTSGTQTKTLKYADTSGVERCWLEFPDQETRRLEFFSPQVQIPPPMPVVGY